jgi:hypothetical protein
LIGRGSGGLIRADLGRDEVGKEGEEQGRPEGAQIEAQVRVGEGKRRLLIPC